MLTIGFWIELTLMVEKRESTKSPHIKENVVFE